MNKLAILIVTFLLVGCSTEATFKDVVNPSIRITVSEDAALSTNGLATWTSYKCDVVLRRYPVCLKHEIRHCLEGQWHGEEDSMDDCY